MTKLKCRPFSIQYGYFTVEAAFVLCSPVYSLEGMHAVRVPVQQFLEFVVEAKLESYTDDAQTEVRDHSDGA